MKKISTITLLCSTIIMTSASAAEQPAGMPGAALNPQLRRLQQDGGQPGTPISAAAQSRREAIQQTGPSTPDIQARVAQTYDSRGILSPDTRNLYVSLDTAQQRRERDALRDRELERVNEEEARQRLERIRLDEVEISRREREQQEALIERARLATSQASADNQLLLTRIAELEASERTLQEAERTLGESIVTLEGRIQGRNAAQQYTFVQLEQMNAELASNRRELAATQQRLRAAETETARLRLESQRQRDGLERLTGGIEMIAGQRPVAPVVGGVNLVAPVIQQGANAGIPVPQLVQPHVPVQQQLGAGAPVVLPGGQPVLPQANFGDDD